MVDDLQLAGIKAFMDIIKGDSSTSFPGSFVEWIALSDFVILIGSSSFASRALDPSTSTHLEATEIRKKKMVKSNSIIPVLFEGRFGTSFPPGLQDTIGGRFTSIVEYMKELPAVAAAILGVKNDTSIASLLDSYSSEVESVTAKSKTGLLVQQHEMAEAKENLKTLQRYWRSRMLIQHSKFSLQQLRQIDGMVTIRTQKIDKYCLETIKVAAGIPPLGMHFLFFLYHFHHML